MLKKFIIHHQLQDSALPRFQYLIDFINAHPLKPADLYLEIDNHSEKEDLFYGNKTEKVLSVPIDACFFEKNKIIEQFFATRFSFLENKNFISVSDHQKKSDHFFQNNRFGFDIFNTLFFHISRYEEYYAAASKNSSAGWLKEDHHFLIKNNLYHCPSVDLLIVSFFEIIIGEKIIKKTTYGISHDVDMIGRFTPSYKFFRSLAATLIYRRDWSQFRKSIRYYKKMSLGENKDPFDYFDRLLRQEENWKYKQIFMMTGGSTKYDNKYRIDDSAAKNIIQLASDRGYSIGIHPSYNAGFEENYFKEEQKNLTTATNQPVVNNRQHWLRWSWNITPYLFEKNEIMTDSTMGYSDHLGFRCGTGFPYRMYDFKNEKKFSWVEHPMAFMDSSAIPQADSTRENLIKIVSNFLLLNQENAHLMLNFHNSNFDPLLASGKMLRQFYENELISICFSSHT